MSEKPLKPQKKDNIQNEGGLFFAALGMGVGTLLSRILGFVRDIVLVGFFPQFVTDAFVLGFKIPNFFRRVMGEGALAVSFIPRFLELKINDESGAKTLKNVVFTFLFCLSGAIAFLGIWFMPQLLDFLLSLSGKGEVFSQTEDMAFAVKMGRWMFFYTFLVTQFAYMMAVLNAHKRFWVAGLAPAFFNLGFLSMALLPDSTVTFSGFQLALGVLVGGALQLLIVGLDHIKHIGWPKFNFSFNFSPFKRVLLATLPSIAGIGVLQFISIINIGLCAQVGVGALTYLYLADRLLELPQSLIAVSLGTAMLPNLSELWVTDRNKFDETLSQSIRLYLFFALPAAVGLVFMALPITQLLFQRGETTLEESMQVANLVQVYGGVLIVSGINRMLLPIYYSFKNTWYPASASVIVVSFHYFVGQIFVESFGLTGVVLTTLVSTTINFLCLFLGLKFFIGRSYIEVVLRSLINFIVPTSVLAIGLWSITNLIPLEKNIFFYIITLAAFFSALLIYFGVSVVFKIKEVMYLKSLFRKLGLKV
jgi:putative peptidoglycan lipid II flippase